MLPGNVPIWEHGNFCNYEYTGTLISIYSVLILAIKISYITIYLQNCKQCVAGIKVNEKFMNFVIL